MFLFRDGGIDTTVIEQIYRQTAFGFVCTRNNYCNRAFMPILILNFLCAPDESVMDIFINNLCLI